MNYSEITGEKKWISNKRKEMRKYTKLSYAAWLVVKIEALLYHCSFLLLSLEPKSTTGKVEGISWLCTAPYESSSAGGYLQHVSLVWSLAFPEEGKNVVYGSRSFCGLEEGVLQRSLLFLLLFYITDNRQSIYWSWSESLSVCPIFFLLIFLSFPSMLQRNPRKVRSCWQSDFSELNWLYLLPSESHVS